MNNQNKERYKKTFDMIHSDAVINITPERSKKLRIHTITRRLSYASCRTGSHLLSVKWHLSGSNRKHLGA